MVLLLLLSNSKCYSYDCLLFETTKLQQTFQKTKKKRENFHFSRFFIKNSLLTSQCSAMGLLTSLTAFGKRKHKIK